MTDIYQSPGDRLRFEIILKSLLEGGSNLAVLSEHDLVLDFYANLIDERLRAAGETHVEFCFSTNSERLVQKFNEILSELTVDQALEKDKKHAPRRFLLFRDSILMQDFELQLLARLVNGFPASNIRVILLINSAGSNRQKLDAFGKNLVQWEVETQAGEAKKPLEDWVAEPSEPAPAEEDASSVSRLFNVPAKPAWRVPGFGSASADQDKMPENVPVLTVAVGTSAASSSAASASQGLTEMSREPHLMGDSVPLPAAPEDDSPSFERPPRKTPWGLITLVLLVSGAAFAFMHRDLLMDEVDQFKKYLLRGTPARASAPAEPASETLAAASDAASVASAEAAEPVASAVPAASEPASAASAASAPISAIAVSAASAVPVTADKVAAKVEAKPEPKAEPKPEPKPEPKTASKAEARSDEAWVNELPDTHYVVQLAAFDTEEEIQTFKRGSPVYAKARIMHARKKDSSKRYYILIAGPFASKGAAEAFMQSNPLLAKGWLRTAKSLKTQFTRG